MTQSRWYKSGWTDERKAKQRIAIQRWKPWEKSTGPRTEYGKRETANNLVWARFKKRTQGLTPKQLVSLIKQF
jgi:hypothetical protein